jgi:hypothetical protein
MMDDFTLDILEKVNIIFYSIFVLETVIKLLGHGFKVYFRQFFNIFDFVIVFISSIDIALTYSRTNVVRGSKAI